MDTEFNYIREHNKRFQYMTATGEWSYGFESRETAEMEFELYKADLLVDLQDGYDLTPQYDYDDDDDEDVPY